MEPSISVAIIEDKRAIREGLNMIINGTPGYRCVGMYESVEDGLLGRRYPRGEICVPDVAVVSDLLR